MTPAAVIALLAALPVPYGAGPPPGPQAAQPVCLRAGQCADAQPEIRARWSTPALRERGAERVPIAAGQR